MNPRNDPDRYERENRRQELFYPSATQSSRISNPRALQHLKEGFNRRLLMIESSLRAIYERVDAAGSKPLSPLLVPELAIHVNSYWLHLCGALDNLAWALQYEFGVLPNVDELGKGRDHIGLFRKKFVRCLLPIQPAVVEALREHQTWYTTIRSLRDPAAHRIPLFPVPAVLDAAQGEITQRLYDEADAHFKTGRLDEGMEFLYRGSNQGEYQPLVAISNHGKSELMQLLPLVQRDEDAFVSVSQIVLKALFADPREGGAV